MWSIDEYTLHDYVDALYFRSEVFSYVVIILLVGETVYIPRGALRTKPASKKLFREGSV